MMHGNLPSVATPRIYLYGEAVDMRKSFDGLMAIVQTELQRDVREGELFVFLNRRADRLKALWWDGDGLAIFMKRLEAGTFQRPNSKQFAPGTMDTARYLIIDRVHLGLLLSSIELSSVRRRKRHQVSQQVSQQQPLAPPNNESSA